MSWQYLNSAACFVHDEYDASNSLSQSGILEVGKEYLLSISVIGMTLGKLRIESFGGTDIINTDGVYQISGVATMPDFAITAIDGFNGCIEFIYVVESPLIQIINSCTGTTAYTVPIDSMTIYKSNIQIHIPWDLPNGEYYVSIDVVGLAYNSSCFLVGDHGCTLLLQWKNNDNAYSIDYENLGQQNNLRLKAKLWKPKYPSKKRDIFDYSNGSGDIIYAERNKSPELQVEEIPEYLHDALAIGIDHDLFYIEGIEHIVTSDDYDPIWRNSSKLAPVQLSVRKKNENLINKNCK